MAIDIKRLLICTYKGIYPLTEGRIYIGNRSGRETEIGPSFTEIHELDGKYVGIYDRKRFIPVPEFLKGDDYDKDFVLHLCERIPG